VARWWRGASRWLKLMNGRAESVSDRSKAVLEGGNYDMTTPFSGGCECGSIRYVCSRAPIAMLNCHCRDCQRSSGAPFASGFIIHVSDTAITGTPKTYSVLAGSGSLATRSFCSECGSPLFTRGETAPRVMSIRFTTLDNPSKFQPMLDIWTSSAQPWTCFSEAIPHYPQSP
jgi:hypothetical protein